MSRQDDWQEGDVVGRDWNGVHRNFSADGREMGRRAADVFRETLGTSVRDQLRTLTQREVK